MTKPVDLDRYLRTRYSAAELKKFELLSAYYDGQASPKERRLVQYWLDHDPEMRRQYRYLRQIRQSMLDLPIPARQSYRRLVRGVFSRLRRRARLQRLALLSSGAIAAMFIVGIVSHQPRIESPELAQDIPESVNPISVDIDPEINPEDIAASEEALMVALNRPILQIPKLATATTTEQYEYRNPEDN